MKKNVLLFVALLFLVDTQRLLAFDPFLDGSTLPEAPWQAFIDGEEDQRGETVVVEFMDPVGATNNFALRLNSGTGANEWFIGAFQEDEVTAGARFRVVSASATGKENILCLTTRSRHLAPAPSITLVDGRFKLWSYVIADSEIMDIGPVETNVFHTVYMYARTDGLVKVWWDGKLIFDGQAPQVNPYDGYFEWGSGSWQFDATDTIDFDWVGSGTVADLPLAVTTTPPHDAIFHDPSAGFKASVVSTPGLAPGVAANGIAFTLNGTDRTADLTISGDDRNRSVSFAGLAPDQSYHAVLKVTDVAGTTSTYPLRFDTFKTNYFTIEAEDFNFDSGQFIDRPALSSTAAPDNYRDRTGVEGVDHHELSEEPGQQPHQYRADSLVATERSRDTLRPAYVTAQTADPDVVDFNVASVETGEWLNYTRTFTAGQYYIYGRLAGGELGTNFVASLGKVTNATSANQTVTPLGAFTGGPGRGFQTYDFVPLTDAEGKLVPVSLSGVETLRVTAVEGAFNPNFYMFVPVPANQPTLQIARSGTGLTLTWTGTGLTLESTAAIGGAWAPVAGATSPFTVTPSAGAQFYRLR